MPRPSRSNTEISSISNSCLKHNKMNLMDVISLLMGCKCLDKAIIDIKHILWKYVKVFYINCFPHSNYYRFNIKKED